MLHYIPVLVTLKQAPVQRGKPVQVEELVEEGRERKSRWVNDWLSSSHVLLAQLCQQTEKDTLNWMDISPHRSRKKTMMP